jgi:hypothetical protein
MHSDDFQKYKRGRVVAERLEKAVKENGYEFRDIFKIKQEYYTRGIAL